MPDDTELALARRSRTTDGLGLFAAQEDAALGKGPTPTYKLQAAATMAGAGAVARQAARERVNATGGRLRCLKALEAAPGGLTRSELATATGLPINTVNARVRELTDPKRHAPLPAPCYTERVRECWLEREGRWATESIVHARTP